MFTDISLRLPALFPDLQPEDGGLLQPEGYLKEYVYRWVQEKMEISLGEVLENMELGKMLPELTPYVDSEGEDQRGEYAVAAAVSR